MEEAGRLPSIEPPEAFLGTRLPSLTNSDTSKAPMAGQLPRGQPLEPADEASDPEAAHDAAAAGGPPVHLVFHREVAFEVPPEQAGRRGCRLGRPAGLCALWLQAPAGGWTLTFRWIKQGFASPE